MKDFFESNNGAYQNKFKEFASKEICHHCSKAFSNKATLKTHVSDVHNSGIDSKTCQFCNHVFSSKSNLSKHMKSKHKKTLSSFRINLLVVNVLVLFITILKIVISIWYCTPQF